MEEANANELNLNKDLFTNSGHHFIGILSPKSKKLLTLPSSEREGNALSDLLFELEDIKFFKIFSNRAKELLAKKLAFIKHGADEFLMRQGEVHDTPQALYVMLNGVVSMQYKPLSTGEEIVKAWPEKILQKDDFFGHVDILHNRPPSVNVQTVGYSELLMLHKDDFHIVQNVMEAHSSKVSHYLRTTEAITRFGWSEEEYKVLEIYSKLCTYAENLEVYGGVENKKPFWSYFVVSGECRIVRELIYSTAESGLNKALPYKPINDHVNSKFQREILEFEVVKQGYYFGVGEELGRNKVIANSTLECLLIPRLLLVFKEKTLLRKMADDLTSSLPSDQEILDNHAKLMSTLEKKTEMFKELFKSKPERLIVN